MTKRTRNKLGQFASFTLIDPKQKYFFQSNSDDFEAIYGDFSVIYGFILANFVIEAKENTKASILNN